MNPYVGEGNKEATVNIDIGNEGQPPAPFVYLPLYAGDVGQRTGRTARVEFATRHPACVEWNDPGELILTVANSGAVISDLVCIEYDLVYCTFEGHGPADGFRMDHFADQASDPVASYAMSDLVPPQSEIKKRITVPSLFGGGFNGIANLYFRARVSTIWTSGIPRDQWDFELDSSVTEYVKRLV